MQGVKHGQAIGALPNKPLENYTYEEEQLAIAFGRFFNRLYQFGLSTTDVSQYNWSAFGNLMGKFAYYTQQKFGNDARIMADAKISMREFDSLIKEGKGELSWLGTKGANLKALKKLWWAALTGVRI